MAAATSPPAESFESSAPTRAKARLRIVLFIVLASAAFVALFVQPRIVGAVREGTLTDEWLFSGPGLLLVVLALALLDVLRGTRRKQRAWGRGLIQLGFGIAVFAFVMTQSVFEYRTRVAPPTSSPELLETLAKSRDARVRALVMEAAGNRPRAAKLDSILDEGLRDIDPIVREAAKAARGLR